jgi:TolB-like protein/Tfp pilus assembly protein PilF
VTVRLGSRALGILSVLAEARGEVVSREELLAKGWPGRAVSGNNLPVQISMLRKALADEDDAVLLTEPGRGYRLNVGGVKNIAAASGAAVRGLSDRPSIAVLPFDNLSDDPQQEYFADGTVEEIITGLSRIKWLSVIARNSTFTYKGRAVDVRQVGHELGVRYVLEGSVRKASNQVRITAQLIDAASGGHLWADRFDGALEDIFELQDELTARVVGALTPKLEQAEIEKSRAKPTESLVAYDYYLRGLASMHRMTQDEIDQALALFKKAMQRDPEYAAACGAAAFCFVLRRLNGWIVDPAQEVSEALRLTSRVAVIGRDDPTALCYAAAALAIFTGDHEAVVGIVDRALMLNPNSAEGWTVSGAARAYLGEPDLAIEHLEKAMLLNPLDSVTYTRQRAMSLALFLVGRYDDAVAWAEKAETAPNVAASLRLIAASHAAAGRIDKARIAMARAIAADPSTRLGNIKDRIGAFSRDEDFEKYVAELVKAGLPR